MGNEVSQAMKSPAIKEMQHRFSKMYPSYLIHGPWHISVQVLLPIVTAALLFSRSYLGKRESHETLSEDLHPLFGPDTTQKLRMALSAYGFAVLYYMKRTVGAYPLVSYTMQSWTLCTLRYAFGSLASSKQSSIQEFFHHIEEFLRFPSLAQNTTTFVVWWILLTPILTVSLSGNMKRLKTFWSWNTSPFLLTVHGINLPFAIFDHLLNPRKLVLHDLWNASALGVSYLWFYLSFLDRNKLPLYIILSPRSRAATLVYFSILGSYYQIYSGFNSSTPAALDYFTS